MVEGIEAYQYELPPELIAQDPLARREDSSLLLVDTQSGLLDCRPFSALPGLLRRGDVLVLNESRVLPARLLARRESSGGRVEFLLIRPADRERTWLALARPARRLQVGERCRLEAPIPAGEMPSPALVVVQKLDQGEVLVQGEKDPGELAEIWGQVPLPPYIRRESGARDFATRAECDRKRYQTVYAAADSSGAGSVAAPTAGLHFSNSTIEQLAARGIGLARIRLHVGPGTFRPPTQEQWERGLLHEETFQLPAAAQAQIDAARRAGGRIIAVGTTSLRVLETVAGLHLPDDGPDRIAFPLESGGEWPQFNGVASRVDGHWEVAGQTRLFIRPPDQVSAVDGLLTNFHLPGSSLLMLVAALAGQDTWREVYRYGVEQRLRFFSYGDCMLIMTGLTKGLA